MIKSSDSNPTSDGVPSTCFAASSAIQSPLSKTNRSKLIIKHLISDRKFVQSIITMAFVISMPWLIYCVGAAFDYILGLFSVTNLPFVLDILIACNHSTYS